MLKKTKNNGTEIGKSSKKHKIRHNLPPFLGSLRANKKRLISVEKGVVLNSPKPTYVTVTEILSSPTKSLENKKILVKDTIVMDENKSKYKVVCVYKKEKLIVLESFSK